MIPEKVVVPVPAIVTEPEPEMANAFESDPLCVKRSRPLSVMAPVTEVTGSVITAVSPELIVPPPWMVFVLVVVVCA